MSVRPRIFIASLALALISHTSARACEFVHVLEQKITSGETRVSINGAYVDKLSHDGMTSLPFNAWLLQGKNIVTVEYTGNDDARFELKRGCRGRFPEDPVLDAKDLNAPGKVQFSFEHISTGEETFLQADALDSEAKSSLIMAVMNFRNAVEERDADSVIRYSAPMFREVERIGFPVQRFEGMLRAAVERGDVTVKDGVWAQEVATGNVLQFVNEEFEPMIVAKLEMDGTSLTMPLGTFWGRFDGVWGVIQN